MLFKFAGCKLRPPARGLNIAKYGHLSETSGAIGRRGGEEACQWKRTTPLPEPLKLQEAVAGRRVRPRQRHWAWSQCDSAGTSVTKGNSTGTGCPDLPRMTPMEEQRTRPSCEEMEMLQSMLCINLDIHTIISPGDTAAAAAPGLRMGERSAAPLYSQLTISLKGINVSANQDEETDYETFQMQINKETKKCSFHTNSGKYWTLVSHGGIQSTATEIAANTMFEIEWRGRRVALRASNGKYICTKKNGQLAAVCDSVGEDEEFTLKLINRPILVLRGDLGFVCYHKTSNTLDANRSSYDVFQIIFNNGAYQIKGQGGKFWYISSNGMICSDGDMYEDFFFEFREYNRVAIKGKNGKYLRGDQAGTLKADAESVISATLWEY